MWFIPPLLASNPVRSQGLGDNNSYIYNKPKTPKEKQEPATRGTLATPCRPEPEHISMRGRLQCASHQSTNCQARRPKTLPEANAREHIQPQTNQCTTQQGGVTPKDPGNDVRKQPAGQWKQGPTKPNTTDKPRDIQNGQEKSMKKSTKELKEQSKRSQPKGSKNIAITPRV